MSRVSGTRRISFGGGAGGSESESNIVSAAGPALVPGPDAGADMNVGAGEISLTVLRRAGELRVRVRRAARCWPKEGEGANINSGLTAIVGDRVNTGLRGEAGRGAVGGGVGGRG